MTKTTKTYTLTDKQRAVIGSLVEGGTPATAAAAAGIEVSTVREWMRRDVAFRAELNAQQRDSWNASAARLRKLVPAALDVIQDTLQGPNRLKAAVMILKAAGFAKLDVPAGLTDPAALEEKDEEDAKLAVLMRL